MKNLLFVVASLVATILAWGVYGPILQWGQQNMSTSAGIALLRPFICVGLASSAVGVVTPLVLLKLRHEPGSWTIKGILFSLAAGALGALGALGIILTFHFGGRPVYVMPLVFGGAAVVHSFLTALLTRRMKELGSVFLAGLIIVLLGATAVLIAKPPAADRAVSGTSGPAEAGPAVSGPAESSDSAPIPNANATSVETRGFGELALQFASVALVICCWGSYGPVLQIGQTAMHNSHLRPLIGVGLAFFGVAVGLGSLWLAATGEESAYNFSGTVWCLTAGVAGAVGALGISMALDAGGRSFFVVPLVFGSGPVVNTLFTRITGGQESQVNTLFVAGLILVIAGSAMVLVFAPKSSPPPKPAAIPTEAKPKR